MVLFMKVTRGRWHCIPTYTEEQRWGTWLEVLRTSFCPRTPHIPHPHFPMWFFLKPALYFNCASKTQDCTKLPNMATQCINNIQNGPWPTNTYTWYALNPCVQFNSADSLLRGNTTSTGWMKSRFVRFPRLLKRKRQQKYCCSF